MTCQRDQTDSGVNILTQLLIWVTFLLRKITGHSVDGVVHRNGLRIDGGRNGLSGGFTYQGGLLKHNIGISVDKYLFQISFLLIFTEENISFRQSSINFQRFRSSLKKLTIFLMFIGNVSSGGYYFRTNVLNLQDNCS